jgi:protein TonB
MNSEPQHPLLDSATLGLWISCLVVGILGLALHYPREHVPAREPPPVIGETMHVELPSEPAAAPVADARAAPDVSKTPPIPDIPQPPAPQDAPAPPEAPQLAAVMTPNPAPAAFVVPAPAPRPPEEPKKPAVAPARPSAPPPVRHLVFGVGEGQQPDPVYPRQAIIAREQGTVGVRFTVGGDGRVLSADVASPCRWPQLNQAAVRAVREHWRFAPGPVRFFDVQIQFQLTE